MHSTEWGPRSQIHHPAVGSVPMKAEASRFAGRITSIAPSATLAMAAKAQKLSSAGVKVYPFSVGEPDSATPPHIIEAAKAALDLGATRYTAVTGTARALPVADRTDEAKATRGR